LIDALEGCIKALDRERLPRLVEQAETCVNNITPLLGPYPRQKNGPNGNKMAKRPANIQKKWLDRIGYE